MRQRTDRTYADADGNALRDNLRLLRARSGGKKVVAVVKADAYGHGEAILPALKEADAFAVATLEEGLRVRRLTSAPVLVLGYVPLPLVSRAVQNDLTLTVYDLQQAFALNERADRPVDVHLKLDTGMHRLGVRPEDEQTLRLLARLDGLHVTGAYSHLAVSKEEDEAYYLRQIESFSRALTACKKRFPDLSVTHLGGSAAIDASCGNAFRVGYALYGYGKGLTPALTWTARVVRVQTLKKGESLGYGRAHVATADERVAVLSVGYGDGYPRNLSGRGRVLYNGVFLPVLGRICMDYCFADASRVTISEGEYVTLLGEDHGKRILPDDLGFGYEILSGISPRVTRVFHAPTQ